MSAVLISQIFCCQKKKRTSDGWAPGFLGVGPPPVAPLRPLRLRAFERSLPGSAAGGAAVEAPGAAEG